MPDLTIAGRQIYFDRQLVAEVHPSLAEGTSLHAGFLALLRAGARVTPSPFPDEGYLTEEPVARFPKGATNAN